MISEQQVFNQIWDHFITKSHSACFEYKMGGGTAPQYRSGRTACAIGILIPDNVYSGSGKTPSPCGWG